MMLDAHPAAVVGSIVQGHKALVIDRVTINFD